MKFKFGNTFEIGHNEVIYLYSTKLNKGALIGIKQINKMGKVDFDVKEMDLSTVKRTLDDLDNSNIEYNFFKIADIDKLPHQEGIVETFDITAAVSVQVEGNDLAISLLQTMVLETDSDAKNKTDVDVMKLYEQFCKSNKVYSDIMNKKIRDDAKNPTPEKEERQIQM